MTPLKKKSRAGELSLLPGKISKRKDVGVDDDDDFQICPPSKRTSIVPLHSGSGGSSRMAESKPQKHVLKAKKTRDEGRVGVGKVFDRLRYRTSPQALVLAIEKLNEAQKKDVVEMGFGSILYLTIQTVPTKLAYWVLDNFHPSSCDIMLKDDKRLHVSYEDVSRVFGFPRGGKKVERKENNEQVESYRRWIRHFGEKKYGVTTRDVLAEITRDGGEGASGALFMINFMILVNACLIESNSTGYVKPQIMDCLVDVTSLKELDWCSYVIDRLVHHKSTWEKNKNNAFCGPILFLTALYVDRVEFNGKKLCFAYPTIKYCTYDDMKRRQKDEISSGDFGYGYPAEPLDLPCEILLPAITNHSDVNDEDKLEDDSLKFAQKFIAKVKDVGNILTEMMKMIEEASESVVKSDLFSQMIDVAQKLLVFNPNEASSSASPRHSQFWFSETQDDFWKKADKAAVLVEIEKAIEKREAFLKVMNFCPNYSLGITQEFGDVADCGKNRFEPTVMTPFKCVNTGGLMSGNQNVEDDLQIVKVNMASDFDGVTEMHSKELVQNKEVMVVDSGANIDNATIVKSYNKGKEKVGVARGVDAQTKSVSCLKGANIVKEHVGRPTFNIATRGKRNIKKSTALLSPYQSRIVDAREKISHDDRVICFWVMQNTDANDDEVLYSNNNIKLKRNEFLTLGPNTFISRGIIDAWSRVSNEKEECRAPSSPIRFYATTNVCLHTVVDAPTEIELDERMLNFHDKLIFELNMVPQMEAKNIDLFFFPVLEAEDCYLICVDVKNVVVDILDHTYVQDVNGNLNKYGKIPVLLRSFMVDFLKSNGMGTKSKKLKDAFMYGEPIPWADDQNKIDCGVFAMRSMETYLGMSKFKNENIFKKSSKMQTRYMRIKYCAAIINSKTNDVAAEGIEKAKTFYAQNCLEGASAIDNILLGK